MTLTNLMPRSRSELQQIFESLRDGGLLPVGGRGPHAPHIATEHAASIAIAVCCSYPLSQSSAFVVEWGQMKAAGGKYSDFAGARTLREALTFILSDPANTSRVREVRVTLDWPRAVIVASDGREFPFGFLDSESAKRAGYQTKPSRFEAILSGSTLSQMALDVSLTDGEAHG